MKIYYLLATVILFCNIPVQAGDIEQVTIADYLQKAKQQAEKDGRKPNHLIDESSPYLLQHAYNPVNWYAWGEEAFARAKKENKPIFLSIGYSTCHWCHVMARESFENEKIAALLNKNFISIKVDREQRPDIDSIYMSATQLISGHGGWPMSVFLDNKLRPFHAATYYPPFTSDGHLGLQDVLLKIHELWLNSPKQIERIAASVTAEISATADDSLEKSKLDKNIKQLALKQITLAFDDEFGGFGSAPKFPRPGIFALLNDLARSAVEGKKTGDKKAKKMMMLTLDMMAAGGVYDQVAGGFHRYSVDDAWQVPHFEKMLYNQALMVIAYSDLYQVEKKPNYKDIVYETLSFAFKEMRSSDGGYYSALDADSVRDELSGEHAEGAYYLWLESELKISLSAEEFNFVKKYFQVDTDGNIFSDPQNEFTDLNILYIDDAYRGKLLTESQQALLFSAKAKLNKKRQQRNRPHLDDKVITAWNGMMITALAKSAKVFDDERFLRDAAETLNYIQKHLLYQSSDGQFRLIRQYRQSENSQKKLRDRAAGLVAADEESPAILADYVWLISGLLEMVEAGGDEQWLKLAVKLQHTQDKLFLDKASGAYFESVAGDESLLFRSKNITDGALPSANAIALSNLRVLAYAVNGQAINGQANNKYSQQADGLVSSFALVINQNPASASMLLSVERQ